MKDRRREEALRQRVRELGAEVIDSERFQAAWEIPHHRTTSVAQHSLNVAKESCRIAEWLERRGLAVSAEDAVRSSLLHDLAMTEKPVFRSPSWNKAYSHPDRGAQLAREEYRANEVQEDAVRRHMWPICVVPPRHREGWIVMAADKISSAKELLDAILPGRAGEDETK